MIKLRTFFYQIENIFCLKIAFAASASKMSSNTAGEITFRSWKITLQSGDSVITFPSFGYFQVSFNSSHNSLPSFLSNFRPELVYTHLLVIPNQSPFSPITQREKKVSITVCASILEGIVAIVKPQNKSVMRMCPGLSSSLSMVSTCTTSLKWVTSVSMMSEWCEHNLHLLMIWVRRGRGGSHR